jgi:hypothetical protein
MKIAEVRTHVLDHRLERAFESASGRFSRRQHVLVEVVCDDGTTGWGECLGPALPNAAIVKAYAGWLTGANPLETEKIWLTLYNALRDQGQSGLTVTALSGIDIALWDIKGKHFGVPVSVLLGGRLRDSVRAYATGSFRKDGVDRVTDIAGEVAGYRREGFHAVKVKIGFDVEEDLRVLEAVREAIGPDMRLMIDANHGYDTLEAIELGNRAAHLGIDWFEEPVAPEHLAGYRELRARQPIPVAGGVKPGIRAGACANPSKHAASTSCSRTFAARGASPKCAALPTWLRCMASDWYRMFGARRYRSLPACSSWPPFLRTRRGQNRWNRSWSSTAPTTPSVRRRSPRPSSITAVSSPFPTAPVLASKSTATRSSGFR